jgi:DNA-binding PadR family transcriptional regulator
MLDKIILGMLKERPMTGYEIKKEMEQSTDFFYNTSYGSIYPMLKKLEESCLVTCIEDIQMGRLRKTYTITASGMKEFENWLAGSMEIARLKDEAILRFFFYSSLDYEKRSAELHSYVVKLRDLHNELQELKKKLSCEESDRFKLATLDFGIDYYGFLEKWFKDFIENGR